ncbi:MAG: DUF4157 domain-containing protein [Streptomyces sp.]|nr:DUF4157 domain-containing protein [Streptomyces sp.]
MERAHGTRASDGEREKGRRAVPGLPTPAQRILALQRLAGNAAVSRAVEEERHEHGPVCGHEQPTAVHRSAAERSSVIDAVNSPYRPLDSRIREKAERGYGMSFGHVRVHSGPVAQQSAVELQARAYTTGSDIVVGPQGADDEVMFHELGHVRQQSLGQVAGTDNGAGVKVSHRDDPFEKQASSNGRKMAMGGMPDLSSAGSDAGTADRSAHAQTAPAERAQGPIHVARMETARSARTMHRRDRGELFEIDYYGESVIGRYVGPSARGQEIFDTSQHGRIEVRSRRVLGPRARVGGLHPPGRVRPEEENFRDRTQISLSDGDLSWSRARIRREHGLADDMGVTTFEDRPNYAGYRHNREDLRRLGVPVMHNVDLSRPEAAERLRNIGPDANVHFQMPRVPRGTPGYSTQQLVRDTSRLPERMGRDDVTVSFTVPHPDTYARVSTHNTFYGLESRRAVPEGMQVVDEFSDDQGDLEADGYGHRQSTKDMGAEVAEHRKKYQLRRSGIGDDRRSVSPEPEALSSSRRRRERSRGRSRGPAAPDLRERSRYGRRLDDEEWEAAEERRERSRHRSRVTTAGRARATSRVSRRPVVDVSGAYEYGGGVYERERDRVGSRAAADRIRARSRVRRSDSVDYAAVDSEDDYPVSSQQARGSLYESDRHRRGRRVVLDSDDE